MCVLSELSSINAGDGRQLHWLNVISGHISVRLISIYESISSWSWKYSGGGVGFIAAAAVLTSTAACGAVGLLLKDDAHSYAPLRRKSGRAVNQAGSSVQGASDATAS
jgi:hypothetical protein